MPPEKETTEVIVTGKPVEPVTPLTAEEKAATKAADKLATDAALAEKKEAKEFEDARVKRNKEIDTEVTGHFKARKEREKAKEADLSNWEADLRTAIRNVLEERDRVIAEATAKADEQLLRLRGDVEY